MKYNEIEAEIPPQTYHINLGCLTELGIIDSRHHLERRSTLNDRTRVIDGVAASLMEALEHTVQAIVVEVSAIVSR